MKGIEAINLSKTFKDITAVNDISFSIDMGEVIGFLGPNGAGKTTTMRMLTTYLKADGGTARIKDLDITEHPLTVRRLLGYLPENSPLYEEMSVLEYLDFVARLRGIPRAEQKTRISEVIGRCGLAAAVPKFIGELSKGYRQRVCLAQALIHNPDILILDEPTNGLDPQQIIEIRELIRQIGKEKTIILSTHIMQEVAACCNRVIIINQGKIVASGKPDELSAYIHGGNRITLLLTADSPDLTNDLAGIASVKNVTSRVTETGIYYDIVADRDLETRRDIFSLVKNRNATLLELAARRGELEDTFLEIIREDNRQ